MRHYQNQLTQPLVQQGLSDVRVDTYRFTRVEERVDTTDDKERINTSLPNRLMTQPDDLLTMVVGYLTHAETAKLIQSGTFVLLALARKKNSETVMRFRYAKIKRHINSKPNFVRMLNGVAHSREGLDIRMQGSSDILEDEIDRVTNMALNSDHNIVASLVDEWRDIERQCIDHYGGNSYLRRYGIRIILGLYRLAPWLVAGELGGSIAALPLIFNAHDGDETNAVLILSGGALAGVAAFSVCRWLRPASCSLLLFDSARQEMNQLFDQGGVLPADMQL